MDVFLNICRAAFRRVYGLSDEPAPRIDVARLPTVLELARRHRVQGLLFAGIPELAAELQTATFGQTRFAAQAAEEAGLLFARLKTRWPHLTLLKGPALAEQAWPEPGMRSFDDLDLRCRPCSFAVMRTRLQTAGCTLDMRDRRRARNLWHFGWGVPFRKRSGLLVEINHRFFPPHYPWPGTVRLRDDRGFTELPLGGVAVRTPTPALHLLFCCLHAVWHGWARMAWLVDIGGLLVRHPEIYAEARRLASNRSFARNALAGACGVAVNLWGLEATMPEVPAVPTRIRNRVGDLASGAARPLRGRELRALHESFMTRREIMVYRLRRALIPGDSDFRWIGLAPSLRWLYWFLRPVRAVWR